MPEKLKKIIQEKLEADQKKDKRGPKTPHQLLAIDIAESFGKLKSRRDINILMKICKNYPLSFVQHVWDIVREKNIDNKMAYFLAVLKKKRQEQEEEKAKNTKIIFLGSSSFGLPSLQVLLQNNFSIAAVITQPDKPQGRKKTPTPTPIKVFAQQNNLPVFTPSSKEEIEKIFQKLKPDLGIVVSYGQIIPSLAIKSLPLGILNIHPSLLPKYRGPSPIQTALLQGEKITGVTIIKIDEKIDHGPILKKVKYKINQENYPELHDKLSKLGAKTLIQLLPQYIKGKIKPTPQNDQKATFTKIIKKEDGKINWTHKASKINNQIRAFYPWPGAWCYLDKPNKKVKIISAGIKKTKGKNKNPGQIIAENKKMVVCCGQGKLFINKLQIEGKKEISGEEFLRGYSQAKFLK